MKDVSGTLGMSSKCNNVGPPLHLYALIFCSSGSKKKLSGRSASSTAAQKVTGTVRSVSSFNALPSLRATAVSGELNDGLELPVQ